MPRLPSRLRHGARGDSGRPTLQAARQNDLAARPALGFVVCVVPGALASCSSAMWKRQVVAVRMAEGGAEF